MAIALAMDPVGMNFLKTIPGLFKLLEIALPALSLICSTIHSTSWSWSLLAFFNTVALMCLCYAAAIIVFQIVHCTTGFPTIPWHKVDSVMSILLAVLVFISTSLFISYHQSAALAAAVVFGYCNAFVFMFNAIYKIVFSLH